jgi:hypothetical protein
VKTRFAASPRLQNFSSAGCVNTAQGSRRHAIRSTKPQPVLDVAQHRATNQPRWILLSIYAASGFFMLVLLIAAFFAPSLRLLHFFQALIYAAIIVMARRKSPWGFGAGCLIAGFWNYIVLRMALPDISALMAGNGMRPDIALQLAAAVAHFVLIVACLAGFLRQNPGWRDWTKFLSAGLVAIGYLVVLMITMRPQYVPLLKKCFGLL